MRTSERHHLKDNELAIALGHANEFVVRHKRTVTMTTATIVLVGAAAVAFYAWRKTVDNSARELLAQAMVVADARVMPATPGPDPQAPSAQQPGTYPTETAKLEAALSKFTTAADRYPATEPGRMARYHLASTLVSLGRFDEAIQQYDQLTGAGGLIGQGARLGKAEAQLRSGKYDGAIATFKELSERSDTNMPKEAVLLELARAYKLAGKTEDAQKTLNEIVEKHSDSPSAAEARQELEKIKG